MLIVGEVQQSSRGDEIRGDIKLKGDILLDDSGNKNRVLEIKSNPSGGLNTSDSTGRLWLHSHQKAQKNNDGSTNSGQAHYGEVVRIDLEHSQAKGAIAFRENYLANAEGPRTVAWLVAHGEANDSTPQNPSWHNHFSVEIPDQNGMLQTALEFPFGQFNVPNAFGLPVASQYVRSVRTLIAASNVVVEGANSVNKNIYFHSDTYNNAASRRWGVQTDSTTESGSNVGSDFRINSYNDAGTYTASPIFIKRSNGYIGVATSSPTRMLDINSDSVRLRTAKTPASSTATGDAGQICWDAGYLYICTATNTWRRIAHSTW